LLQLCGAGVSIAPVGDEPGVATVKRAMPWRSREQEQHKMTESRGKSNKGKRRINKEIRNYIDRLSDEHRMLVVLKAQLYDGSWKPMLDDLHNRLAGKPYIFKLVHRIEDDIKRIEEMQAFEDKHNIDLADHVDLP
jgi:hypothetical protein